MTQATNTVTAAASAVTLRSPLAALADLPGWKNDGTIADGHEIVTRRTHLAEIQIDTSGAHFALGVTRICASRRALAAYAAHAPEKLDAALAHEIGHLDRVHSVPDLAGACALRAADFIAPWLVTVSIFVALGGAPTVSAVLLGAGLLIGHIRCHLCRRHEYAADRYAVGLVGTEPVIRYLTGLQESTPTGLRHRLRLAFGSAAHPSPAARIKRLGKTQADA